MKASELRIGNLVISNNNSSFSNFKKGDIVEVSSIGYGGVNACESRGAICYDHDIDDLVGIPLTEEWLLKFGFEKVKANEENYDSKFAYNIPSWGQVALKKGVLQSDEYYFLDGLTQDIKYVHQLQSLYFALTSEELTIKN